MVPSLCDTLYSTTFDEEHRLTVTSISDRFAAAVLAERAARRLAFPGAVLQAARIVACELAENAVRHGGGGTLRVAISTEPGLLRIAADDHGPPFRNVDLACSDGSTDQGPIPAEQLFGRHGIGSGLGAVRRLATALVIVHGPAWKEVLAFLGAASRREASACPLELRVSHETRPPAELVPSQPRLS